MFYAQTQKIIDKNLTYLDTTSVFTGQYWDEFGITSYLIPPKAHVLMLGLSFGGGIRPILGSDKDVSLICVDYDTTSVKACRDFYKKYFPEIQFEARAAEAMAFLKSCTDKYNCIWLDIYEDNSYSHLYFNHEFFDLLKHHLTDDGVLLINSYGLPNQFSPLNKEGIQSRFCQFLSDHFKTIKMIPYRRNLTLVASRNQISIYPTKAHPSLNPLDKQTFQSFEPRLHSAQPIPKITSVLPSTGLFVEIDAQMREQWNEIRNYLSGIGQKIETNLQILDLIQDASRAQKVASQMLSEKSALIAFLPILCAGESQIKPIHVDWIFDWTIQNSEELKRNMPEIYHQIWLPQIWSMILQSSKQYRKYYFSILPLLKKDF